MKVIMMVQCMYILCNSSKDKYISLNIKHFFMVKTLKNHSCQFFWFVFREIYTIIICSYPTVQQNTRPFYPDLITGTCLPNVDLFHLT